MSGTVIAGVMGWPIAHSRSPLLHGTWLRRYDVAGAYVPLAVRPEHLEQALRALPALGIAGVNLTVPHKEAAARIVDRLTPAAERIGSVNMVTVLTDRSLEGESTDGRGFLLNLQDAVPDRPVDDGVVLVIGAGGAALAVVDALLRAGETRVVVVNRTDARAQHLAALFGSAVEPWPWDRRADALAGAGLVINATSLGMVGQPPLEIDLTGLRRDAVVADIVYTPLATPLLAAARARGNRVVDGLGMLLHQARPAFARWFGVDPQVDADLRDAVIRTLGR